MLYACRAVVATDPGVPASALPDERARRRPAQGRPDRATAARAWLARLLAALVAVAEVALVPLVSPTNAPICARAPRSRLLLKRAARTQAARAASVWPQAGRPSMPPAAHARRARRSCVWKWTHGMLVMTAV